MTPEFVHNNITDKSIQSILNDKIKANDIEHDIANREFYTLLENEMEWRNTNNRHYSEEQKERDTLELIALVEAAVRENKTMEEIGKIRIPTKWHERPALVATKYHTVEELEKYGIPPTGYHWMKHHGVVLIGQDNKPIASEDEDL